MSRDPDYAHALARAEQTFRVEAAEMLDRMEQCLLQLEAGTGDGDVMNALFRSVHTIKGSAGLFGLHAVVSMAHGVETVLDDMRSGRVPPTPALVSALLRAGDHLRALLDAPGEAEREHLAAASADVLAPLLDHAAPVVRGTHEPTGDPNARDGGTWHVSLHFLPDCHLRGVDPLATVRYLDGLGEIEVVELLVDHIPPLESLDPEKSHLAFEIRLRTDAPEATLRDALEFIEGDCDIRLIPPFAGVDDYVRLIRGLPADSTRLGEILVASGAVSERELHDALAQHHARAAAGAEVPRVGDLLVSQGTDPRLVDAALQRQRSQRERDGDGRVIRVDAGKLDTLVNLVGEIVIAHAAAQAHLSACGQPEILEPLARLLDDVRASALSLRMVPIGDTFARFQRVVRDVARDLAKEVVLDIHGGETELDKSLVERISDPLMHLVRNALDHGIEPPDVRSAAGKPRVARLTLSALQDAGSIVIRVEDDGRGIDIARVRQKALAQGLIHEGDTLSDAELRALIFKPGFSTAETVTDISGRGVGMDVVREHVEQLHGRIHVDSTPGRGTRFEIRLPLTLAIIDGFLVKCGGSKFVVPLDCIEECIAAAPADAATCTVIAHRGEVMSVVDVARALGLARPTSERRSILVCWSQGMRFGLLVDQLVGEYQTVVKPLGTVFERLDAFSGSTILGSGDVALILNVESLVARFSRAAHAPRARPAMPA